MIHTGNLTITPDTLGYAQTLTTITGWLYVEAPCSLPQLTSVGGGLHVWAPCSLPALTTLGGWLAVEAPCSLPQLTSVGGGLHVRADCSLPQLASTHGQPGRLLAVSTYGLWLSVEGRYYAGCRGPWSKAEALAHLAERTDTRAQVFTKAIKENV